MWPLRPCGPSGHRQPDWSWPAPAEPGKSAGTGARARPTLTRHAYPPLIRAAAAGLGAVSQQLAIDRGVSVGSIGP
jgi:hypothetical protein